MKPEDDVAAVVRAFSFELTDPATGATVANLINTPYTDPATLITYPAAAALQMHHLDPLTTDSALVWTESAPSGELVALLGPVYDAGGGPVVPPRVQMAADTAGGRTTVLVATGTGNIANNNDQGASVQLVNGGSVANTSGVTLGAANIGLNTATDAERIFVNGTPIADDPAFLTRYGYATNVLHFGALGDGVTDDTAAVQAAITAAGTYGAVWFPPTAGGYLLQMLTVLTGQKLIGLNTRLIHYYPVVVQGTGGAGSTKAFPIFLATRITDVTIEGFVFTSSASVAAIQATIPGWESYLAPIVIHRSHRTAVRFCRFEGTEVRGIFQHGGDDTEVAHNVFTAQSMIVHVGYQNNPNFWDAGGADATVWFSPRGLKVIANTFHDYNTATSQVIFLSGVRTFTIADNIIRAATTTTAIHIYTNDLGLTDAVGNPLLTMFGSITGNSIDGTADALFVTGYSSSATGQNHELNVDVADNQMKVTGHGVTLMRANHVNVHHNHVIASGSAVRLNRELDAIRIVDNYLESATGENANAIATSTATNLSNAVISRNTIISGAGNDRAIYIRSTFTCLNVDFTDNDIAFNGTAANPIVVQIVTATGALDLSSNKYRIASSTMANRPLYDIGGTADIVINKSRVISSTVQIARSDIACASLTMTDSVLPGIAAVITAEMHVTGGKYVLSTGGAGAVLKATGGTFVSFTNVWAEIPVALNQPTIQAEATARTLVLACRVIGNSTGPTYRQGTSGAMTRWGNVDTNNGAGGTGVTITGTATAAAMT